MTHSPNHELFVEVRAHGEVTDFTVVPPLSEDEIAKIEASQGPRSMLGEIVTYLAQDGEVTFRVPDSTPSHDLNTILVKELASAVMVVRGIAQSRVKNGDNEFTLKS